MANKFIVLDGTKDAHGAVLHRVLYIYDLAAAPVLDSTSAKRAPAPAANLPADASGYVSPGDQTLMTNGDLAFELRSIQQTAGETNLQVRNRILVDLAERATYQIAEWRAKYALSGTAVSA